MGTTIIRERATLDQTGLSGSTMYRRIKDGLFMKPFQISQRCVGWVAEHVDQYNSMIASGASEDDIRAFVSSVAVPAPRDRKARKGLKRIRLSDIEKVRA